MKVPFITIGLAGLCLLITALFGDAPQDLIYHKVGVGSGELWRLFSAHFSHSDFSHLAWNIAALLMIGSLLEQRIGKAIIGVYAVGITSVNIYLLVGSNLIAYCGLSGVLNSVLVALLSMLIQDKKTRWIGILTVGLALAKIVTEMQLEQALFIHTAWPSVPLAHLYGFMGGVVWSVTRYLSHPLAQKYKHKPISTKTKGDYYA